MNPDRYAHDPNVLGDYNINLSIVSKCSSCGHDGYNMPCTFELPKHKDRKFWEIAKLIFQENNFKTSKSNTLAYLWHLFKGNTIHMPSSMRKIIWFPKNIQEFDNWKKFMLNTKFK